MPWSPEGYWWVIAVGTSAFLVFVFALVGILIANNRRLREQRDFTARVLDASPALIIVLDNNGRIHRFNKACERITGYSAQEVVGLELERLSLVPEDMVPSHGDSPPVRHANGTFQSEKVWLAKDGTQHTIAWSSTLLRESNGSIKWIIWTGIDITERKRLQEQFYGAQRMEAIGRLAGGVAHDFNNLLTAITGYSHFLLSSFRPDDPRLADLQEITAAAEKAASLTRQLLAFSRRQVFSPKVLDINKILESLERMLRRLIGEDIELSVHPYPSLGRIKADPAQIEQVIMNLVVNARDAMPQGGQLIIETANVELDEAYVMRRPVVKPGSYVLLAVSDTGIGMDKETQSRVFEPFFSTKEKGKGTGLGLSTVYGIVKQSGGYIWVYSEPGHGSTFKIYLPRTQDEETVGISREVVVPANVHGAETVLVVEDDHGIRRMACRTLKQHGYRVLAAHDGQTALQVSEQHAGDIDVMVTDVVMPGMSGRELADRLQADRPEMKVIYMSGYTDNAIVHHGLLDDGVDYLQKPFSPQTLLRVVREVLDKSEQPSSAGPHSG